MSQITNDHITARDDPWWWYYRFWAIYVMLIQSLIGVAIIFGPDRWLTFNSAGLIHKYTDFIPWFVWGVAFLFSGIGTLFRQIRRAAYSLAFLLNAFFSIAAALYSIFAPARMVIVPEKDLPPNMVNIHPNPIAIGLSLYGPLVMIAGVRFVLLAKKKGI